LNDPKGFTGNPRLDKMLGFPTETVDVNPDETPPQDPDIWEAPSGYIRTTRTMVFSLILIKKNKEFLMIPYSAIESGTGVFNGDTFRFTFFIGEAAYEATIVGTVTHMQRVCDKIAGGKAEMIRSNDEEITSITWEPVPEELAE
jgi:hypothetical protein